MNIAKNTRKIASKMLSLYLLLQTTCFADQTIINNYSSSPNNSAPSAPSAPSCNSNQNSNNDKNDTPPGMQIIQNGDGSSSRVFSTGTKNPYIVDNNCNSQPIIQPYIYPGYPNVNPHPGPFNGGGGRR
jgi:hypothetical protein